MQVKEQIQEVSKVYLKEVVELLRQESIPDQLGFWAELIRFATNDSLALLAFVKEQEEASKIQVPETQIIID